jgi:Trk K+ transport system NAD-binding subunit
MLQLSEEPGHGERPRGERENRRTGTLRRWLRGIADSIPRPIRIALVALALVAAVSVLIFQRTMNLSPIDALYFLIATLTTTGFGDISFAGAPWQLKRYGCVLMLCGGLLMAAVVSVMTDVLVSLRLRDVLAVRRLPPSPHVILAGLGSVGYRIARELCESGESVVVVTGDTDDEYATALCGSAMIVVGDPSREESLRKAGLEQAKAVVAITENDVTNLGIALTARTINPAVRTVIRVFDAALAGKLQTDLAIDRVISVSAVSAPTLVAVALHADAHNAVVWREHLLTVFLERATDGRPTDGAAQTGRNDLEVRLCEVRVGDTTRLEILPEKGPTADGSRVMRIGCARLRSPG